LGLLTFWPLIGLMWLFSRCPQTPGWAAGAACRAGGDLSGS